MISFIIALAALVAGYLFYGKFVERVFAPDDRPTPAVSMADGVDYIAMPNWKVFMIQFLNIMIKFFRQIILELFHAKRAVTFSTKFIGNMPHQKSRMISHRFIQFCDNGLYFFPIHL